MSNDLTKRMLEAARAAGAEILRHYNADELQIERKGDGSPVTMADQAAECIILEKLANTGIPVLGEESVAAGKIPVLGNRFFVVDPLDGTKEFIKRNDEFTVNIALVEEGVPIAGVVTAPAMDQEFFADEEGAYFASGKDAPIQITTSPDGPNYMVASRSHGHSALQKLYAALEVEKDVSVGSSLKLCMVAKGEAKFYPRFTPTCEWDIAAGHAILARAGGEVLTLGGDPLRYGKSDQDFYNPFFAAAASLEIAQNTANKMTEFAPPYRR